jgi:trk system potassium uptake protein TrkA
LLDDLLEMSPDLLIAVTNDDETNLVSCCIAKNLGYKRTVARVRDNRYLNRTRLDFARLFDIDYFIGPELLVAHDILKYMISPGSLAVEHFAHGAVQMRTLTIPPKWKKSQIPLSKLSLPQGMMVGLICRDVKGPAENPLHSSKRVIFPHGEDVIMSGDEITLIGETDVISEAHQLFSIPQKKIQSVTIVGGSGTAINLAKLLQHHGIELKIIEKDYAVCCRLSDLLPKCIILNHDATDLEFLISEKIASTDVFVTCTQSDEVNILSGMLAKKAGCQNVVVMLSNTSYAPIVNSFGLDYTVAPRLCAASHILSQIMSGKVTSLISLYENQAEIMEVNVSVDSNVVGIPLSELGPLLPKDFLICMIQNRGRIMIANGNRVISPGDTVIVITGPKHVRELEKIF